MVKENNIQQNSHRRYNILTQEWVLVSPHRTKRPWQGQQEKVVAKKRPTHDPDCYLCAGNTRANGQTNPLYTDTFVFTNDFAALQQNTPGFTYDNGLLQAKSEKGICKVVCFSADHSKSLAQLPITAIEKVVALWMQEYKTLSKEKDINYIQIFENKGAVMGCSNPHPHGQIWAQEHLPNIVEKLDASQKAYFEQNNSSLLEAYVAQELQAKERIVFENRHVVALVPFWAVWPFQVMIIPKKQAKDIADLSPEIQHDFAQAIKMVTKAYDAIFDCSFPYSAGIHQSPCNNKPNTHWHWHMSFYPPLLRSASVKKFMVGYEMFAMPQRDITAEHAAKRIVEALTK